MSEIEFESSLPQVLNEQMLNGVVNVGGLNVPARVVNQTASMFFSDGKDVPAGLLAANPSSVGPRLSLQGVDVQHSHHRTSGRAIAYTRFASADLLIPLSTVTPVQYIDEISNSKGYEVMQVQPDSVLSFVSKKHWLKPHENLIHVPVAAGSNTVDLRTYVTSGGHVQKLLHLLAGLMVEHRLCPLTQTVRPIDPANCYVYIASTGDKQTRELVGSSRLAVDLMAAGADPRSVNYTICAYVGDASYRRGMSLLTAIVRQGGPVRNSIHPLLATFSSEHRVVLFGTSPVTDAFPNVAANELWGAIEEAIAILVLFNGVTMESLDLAVAHVINNLPIANVQQALRHGLNADAGIVWNKSTNTYGPARAGHVNAAADNDIAGWVARFFGANPPILANGGLQLVSSWARDLDVSDPQALPNVPTYLISQWVQISEEAFMHFFENTFASAAAGVGPRIVGTRLYRPSPLSLTPAPVFTSDEFSKTYEPDFFAGGSYCQLATTQDFPDPTPALMARQAAIDARDAVVAQARADAVIAGNDPDDAEAAIPALPVMAPHAIVPANPAGIMPAVVAGVVRPPALLYNARLPASATIHNDPVLSLSPGNGTRNAAYLRRGMTGRLRDDVDNYAFVHSDDVNDAAIPGLRYIRIITPVGSTPVPAGSLMLATAASAIPMRWGPPNPLVPSFQFNAAFLAWVNANPHLNKVLELATAEHAGDLTSLTNFGADPTTNRLANTAGNRDALVWRNFGAFFASAWSKRYKIERRDAYWNALGNEPDVTAMPDEYIVPLAGLFTKRTIPVYGGLWPMAFLPLTRTVSLTGVADYIGQIRNPQWIAELMHCRASVDLALLNMRIAPSVVAGAGTPSMAWYSAHVDSWRSSYHESLLLETSASDIWSALNAFRNVFENDALARAALIMDVDVRAQLYLRTPRVGMSQRVVDAWHSLVPRVYNNDALAVMTGAFMPYYFSYSTSMSRYLHNVTWYDGPVHRENKDFLGDVLCGDPFNEIMFYELATAVHPPDIAGWTLKQATRRVFYVPTLMNSSNRNASLGAWYYDFVPPVSLKVSELHHLPHNVYPANLADYYAPGADPVLTVAQVNASTLQLVLDRSSISDNLALTNALSTRYRAPRPGQLVTGIQYTYNSLAALMTAVAPVAAASNQRFLTPSARRILEKSKYKVNPVTQQAIVNNMASDHAPGLVKSSGSDITKGGPGPIEDGKVAAPVVDAALQLVANIAGAGGVDSLAMIMSHLANLGPAERDAVLSALSGHT